MSWVTRGGGRGGGYGIQIWDGGGEIINQRAIFLGQLKITSHELWNTV